MRFFRVKINGIFLSRSGTDFVEPCELNIPNVDQLFAAYVGSVAFTASGKAVNTVVAAGSAAFEIQITKLYQTVFQQLVDLSMTNLADQSETNDLASVSFPVEIIGFDEEITFDAVFNPQDSVTKESFIDGRNYKIVLRLIKL